jgi:hypothetical protein
MSCFSFMYSLYTSLLILALLWYMYGYSGQSLGEHMHTPITSQRGGLGISERLREEANDIPARRPPPRDARRPLRPTRSPWTIWMTPEHQRVTIGDFECLPTRTTSTPRRRVFNPPSIAMINAPYSSDPIACVLTHNQR